MAHIYDKCISDLEQHLHAIPPALAMNPQAQALRSLLEAVVMARNSRDGITALGLLQKVSSEAVHSSVFFFLEFSHFLLNVFFYVTVLFLFRLLRVCWMPLVVQMLSCC